LRAARPAPGGSPATSHRLIAGAIVFLMLLAIVFTKSRSGFLGLGAMVAVLLYYGQRLKPGLATAGVILLLAILPLLPSSFWLRMSSITDESEDVTGSRAARRQVAMEAAQVFMERPLTGIGAGQFKNYNPPGRQERWREAHDVWLQVASETGIFGVLAFGYLVVAAFRAALWSRKRIARFIRLGAEGVAPPKGRRRREPGPSSAPATVTESVDLGILHLQATALVPSLVGWFVCALFASVAYNWTFYYLLGLCIATRELSRAAIAARTAPLAAANGHEAGRRVALAS
jgi:O-antigen ligase